MKIEISPAQYAVKQGLSGLKEVITITGQSRQTLQNWHKHKPELFRAVVVGCATIGKKKKKRKVSGK